MPGPSPLSAPPANATTAGANSTAAPATARPAWVTLPSPYHPPSGAAAWAWVPAVATVVGAAVPIAFCVGIAFWVGRVDERAAAAAADRDVEAARAGRACDGSATSSGRTGARAPPRAVVAVIQPDGGACAAAREEVP